ncbi:MAG: hypothetical protein IJW24_00545 [Clostridia bacterium]|nr:hypothetical protein [Clostridia bacterium]
MKDNRKKMLKQLGLASSYYETVRVDNNYYIIEDIEDKHNTEKFHVQMYMPKLIGGKIQKFHVASATYELVQDTCPQILVSYPSTGEFYFAEPIIKSIESIAAICGVSKMTVVSNHPYHTKYNSLEELGFERVDDNVFEKTELTFHKLGDHLSQIMEQAQTPYIPESSF